MKNVILFLSLLLNATIAVLFLREKGGCHYISKKLGFYHTPVIKEQNKAYLKYAPMYRMMPRIEKSIVFAGNSLTRDCDWAELLQNPKIRNRGIGGDCALGVLQRIDEILDPPPEKIFFELGLSDLARGFSQTEIIALIKQIIDSAYSRAPDIQLYIQSILPVREGIYSTHPFGNKEIIELNLKFKDLAQRKMCTYIDLHPHFLDSAGQIDSTLSSDGVHINAKGYAIWKNLVTPYILPQTR